MGKTYRDKGRDRRPDPVADSLIHEVHRRRKEARKEWKFLEKSDNILWEAGFFGPPPVKCPICGTTQETQETCQSCGYEFPPTAAKPTGECALVRPGTQRVVL